MFGLFETFFESEAKSNQLVLPSNCVSFSFVFLCVCVCVCVFFFRFRFKRNREKQFDHGSQNYAVEPWFEWFPTFLA